VIHVWFVLPDGDRVATQAELAPRRGDIVRFASDGAAYEVAQIEHIATPQGRRHGMRYTQIIVRLAPMPPPA
jgi:hypothetical protein